MASRFRLFDDKLPGEKQRVFWSSKENKLLLSVIERMQVVKALVRKRQKNADIFMAVEAKMQSEGSTKTWQQIRSRWKRMKSEYIREKRLRSRRELRNSTSTSPSGSSTFETMTKVLGKYADVIECTSAYLGEEEGPPVQAKLDDDVEVDGENGTDGEVRVQVELIEGDAALEQSMTVEGDNEVQEIKAEPLSPPPSSPALSEVPAQDDRPKETRSSGNAETDTEAKNAAKTAPTSAKVFASEYARKHAFCLREWQEQYQEWYERQVEAQQQWEETFMREQMELAKSMLENVTSTFLQGMQQVLQNVMGSVGRRSMTPLVPTYQSRSGLDLNGLNLNQADIPIFINSEPNGPTVLSTRSLSDDHQSAQ